MRPKNREPRIFEYRIKYNSGLDHSALDSCHFYSAISAEKALEFHFSIMKKKSFQGQVISVEEKNPFSRRWEDMSHVIKETLE